MAAKTEPQDMRNTVEFFGETFHLNEKVPKFALMEFAEAATSGAADSQIQTWGTMLRLSLACIAPEEESRFRGVARSNPCEEDDLTDIFKSALSQSTERPTSRLSDSSDGPADTGRKSASNSASKGSERLAGRPDLQLAVANTKKVA